MVQKPQFNRKCVLYCEVSILVSPASKKRQALEMAHKLRKKKHKIPVPLDNVTVETDHNCDSERSEICVEDYLN